MVQVKGLLQAKGHLDGVVPVDLGFPAEATSSAICLYRLQSLVILQPKCAARDFSRQATALRMLAAAAGAVLDGVTARALAASFNAWPESTPSTSGSCSSRGYASHPVLQPALSGEDVQHARRLKEMMNSATMPATRRRVPLEQVPILHIPQSTKQPSKSPNQPPAVDWREIVERARAQNETVTGTQMLTDTFKWVCTHPIPGASAATFAGPDMHQHAATCIDEWIQAGMPSESAQNTRPWGVQV